MRSSVGARSRVAVVCAVGFALIGLAPGIQRSAAATPVTSLPWFVTMVSQPMEYIGHGSAWRFDERISTMVVEIDSADHLRFHWGPAVNPYDYTVEITVPTGLTIGHFRSYQHFTPAGDMQAAGNGEIRVSGAGYGCNIVSSGFEIRDLHRDAAGHLDRLDVLYIQHCESLEPALFGEVRLGLPPSRTLRTQPTAVRWPDTLLTTPGTAAPVEVRNLARAAVDVTGVTLAGPGASSYQIDRNGCRRQTITAAKSCLVLVRFHPLRAGPANASLVISTTAGTRRVPLDGTGLGGVTRLHIESDAGDWIGSGDTGQATTYTYTPRTAVYYFRGSAWEEPPKDGLRLWIFASAYGPSWDIQFVAPPNQHLVPGTYVDDIPDWRSRPGLSITGYSRGCQDLQGTFTVHQIEYDPFTHTPIRFDVSFEQHCNGNTDALRGRLQYRATTG